MEKIYLYLLSSLLFGYVHPMSEPNKAAPVIISKRFTPKGFPLFSGSIEEGQTQVNLDAPLRVTDSDRIGGAGFICGYYVMSRKHRAPFTVEIQNRSTGQALVKVKEGEILKCEKRAKYRLAVIAYDCGSPSKNSTKAVIIIRIKDAPRLDQKTYFVELEEHKMYDNLISVQPKDNGRSPLCRGNCDYSIINDDILPFEISNQGVIKNIKPISFSENHNFILEVVAVGCRGKRSKISYVNIKVKEVCKSGWSDIPNHINYDAGSGQVSIMSRATLKWCDTSCELERIKVKLHLATKHIGKGCDRDTYSITSQRKLCGANDESVDLLPSPSLTTTYTTTLNKDDGHESDQIFYFDGETNAVEVPKRHFNHTLHKHFTISTWMKHEYREVTQAPNGRPEKEHILCMSDGDGMSRHHYSLFVHGEKLVFLLRREAEDAADMEVFKPAEWRWHIPQINDGEWHYYAISMDFPHVRLYIDGKMLIPDNTNQEIVDDWPLHKSSKVHSTKLVIGACWQGSKNKFEHYLQGYLAGLSILKDRTESDRVIHCLNSCKENLDFHGTNEMTSGSSVSFNSEMSEFTITGQNVSEVETLVREVVYINARQFPTPGRRNIDMATSVQCGGKVTVLPIVESYVMVHAHPLPTITVSSPHVIQATPANLHMGQRILEHVHIDVGYLIRNGLQEEEEIEEDDDDVVEDDRAVSSSIERKNRLLNLKMKRLKAQQETTRNDDRKHEVLLDQCTLRADPPLNFREEHLTLPQSTMSRYNMRMEGMQTNDGLVIQNADYRENYERVLQELYYYNTNGAKLNSRKFILTCSSQSGRFNSNKLEIQIVAIHSEQREVVHAHAQKSHVQHFQLDNGVSGSGAAGVAHASPNVGMVAIIVVCVGFLLFMIILGVIRIRAAHRRTQVVQVDEKMEMEWDNSALNITVNPMEQQEVFEYEDSPKLRDDSDSDDEVSSYRDDGDSSEDEEETEVKKVKDLEWDDSTLSF